LQDRHESSSVHAMGCTPDRRCHRIAQPDDEWFAEVYGGTDWYFGTEPLPQLAQHLPRIHRDRRRVPRALDLGCGEGRDSLYLARHDFDVLAMDICREGLEKLRRVADRESLSISTRQQDVRELRFVPDSYDIVVARTLLDHLDQKWHVGIAEGIVTTLTSCGMAFVECFTVDDPGYALRDIHASDCARFVRHYFEHGELRQLFAALEVLEYVEYKKEDASHGTPHQHGLAVLVGGRSAPL